MRCFGLNCRHWTDDRFSRVFVVYGCGPILINEWGARITYRGLFSVDNMADYVLLQRGVQNEHGHVKVSMYTLLAMPAQERTGFVISHKSQAVRTMQPNFIVNLGFINQLAVSLERFLCTTDFIL